MVQKHLLHVEWGGSRWGGIGWISGSNYRKLNKEKFRLNMREKKSKKKIRILSTLGVKGQFVETFSLENSKASTIKH